MAAPTDRFRTWALTEAQTTLDLPSERIGNLGSDAAVAHGSPPAGGSPLDFGTIDISGAGSPVDSVVAHIRWDVTADQGNTLVEDFRFWFPTADDDFTDAGTLLKILPISGDDQSSPTLTDNYDVNATPGAYGGTPGWVTAPTTDPGSINMYPSDEGSSMVLSTTSDDAVMWALYLIVDELETTGTYEADNTNYNFRCTYQFSYS